MKLTYLLDSKLQYKERNKKNNNLIYCHTSCLVNAAFRKIHCFDLCHLCIAEQMVTVSDFNLSSMPFFT